MSVLRESPIVPHHCGDMESVARPNTTDVSAAIKLIYPHCILAPAWPCLYPPIHCILAAGSSGHDVPVPGAGAGAGHAGRVWPRVSRANIRCDLPHPGSYNSATIHRFEAEYQYLNVVPLVTVFFCSQCVAFGRLLMMIVDCAMFDKLY